MSDTDTLNLNVNISHKNHFPVNNNPLSFMNVLSLNIQSIRNKIIDFTTFVENSKVTLDIIVLTETHVKENETQFFNLPGYEVEHCVRKSGRFGGVAIYVRKNFSSFNLIHKLDIDQNNSLLIHIQKYDLKIAAIYRQRGSNFANFLNRLDHILDNYNNCYIFGDFNLDLFNIETDLTVKRYYELVQSNGYVFLNSMSRMYPTRVDISRNTSTCIDHVISDAMFHATNISFTLSLDDLFGDHKAFMLNVLHPREQRNSSQKYFTVKKTNHEKIISQNLLANVSDLTFEEFQIDLKSIFDSNTTEYTKREKFIKPYMNKEALNYINIKHNYFKLSKKYPRNAIVTQRFKYYRNLVKKKVTLLRKEFNQKKFERSFGDPKATWQNINNLLRNTDSQKTNAIHSIKHNNVALTNKYQIAESFNAFFVTVTDSIHNSIIIDQNVYNTLHDAESYNIAIPFECPETSPDEILQILSNLSNSNAKDVNGFSNSTFKKYRVSLCEPLSKLINDWLNKSIFPKCLKIAKVNPLHKNGDKMEKNNYRPIAISPIDSKVFESVILDRMEKHLKDNNILCKFQFGYSKGSNCEAAALHVMNQIYQNVEKKLFTAALFIDLTKAFDCLFHDLLTMKLSKLGFSRNFLDLLKSYLGNRFQYVDIDGIKSPLLNIYKGVFQGSRLAAVLFIIYINSFFLLPLHGKPFLYADDTSLVYGEKDLQTLKINMEYDLKIIDIWLNNHYLSMNTKKTQFVLFHGRTRLDFFTTNALKINLNGEIVERVEAFKYLGLWIDEELKFTKHIAHVKSKILPMTFAIKRIRPYISENTARQLYFAHIQSHLSYMNPFWNVAHNTLIQPLAVAQRKCLRFIFNKYSYSPSRELFSQQILPLTVMNDYNLILFAFKITHNLLRNNVELRLVSDIHRYPTRQQTHFYVENFQTSFGLANFFTRGLIAYNNLDRSLKRIHTIARFKNELRNLLFADFLSSGN
jgi:hypothetical protein